MDTSVTNEMRALPLTLEGDHGGVRDEKYQQRETTESIKSVNAKPMELSRYDPYIDRCETNESQCMSI